MAKKFKLNSEERDESHHAFFRYFSHKKFTSKRLRCQISHSQKDDYSEKGFNEKLRNRRVSHKSINKMRICLNKNYSKFQVIIFKYFLRKKCEKERVYNVNSLSPPQRYITNSKV